MDTNRPDSEPENMKKQTAQSGTMSFIDHLDELRSRLIRFFIVLTLCVLAAYFYRKEILDIVRKPIDIPLKKYTAVSNAKMSNKSVPLKSLNCSCQEIQPITPQFDIVETEKVESISPKKSTPKIAIEKTENWDEVLKQGVNDFLVFFQVLLGKDPSPLFDLNHQGPELIQNQQIVDAQSGTIQLNCQCTTDQVRSSAHSTMVYIGLPELFFAQMKVAFFTGLFIAFPYLLIEIWGFVGPAMYRGERKVFWIFSIGSYFFFIGGALFGYFGVFPFAFDFFLGLSQFGEIMPSLSIGEYLSFAIKLLIAFGCIFEMPLVTFILARMGIITPGLMIKQARVAILAVFVISAVLTPPDPFTMMLMAGPLILLYIFSIGVCFIGLNKQKASLRAQGLEDDDFS